MSHHLVQIEHLGIAVKDLEAGNALYTKLLGVPPYKAEVVESEGVRTSFFKAGPNKIELLEATNPESPIAKFIEKRGVKDLEAGNALYTKLLGVPPYKEEVVESEGVRTSFFKAWTQQD